MTPLKTILYVEDDPDIQEVAELFLSNFEVTFAESGNMALEILEHYTPQLIILDMMMPGIDGIETFQAISELKKEPSIPVIFITSMVRYQETELYKKIGALGVIPKPFDAVSLPDNILALWAQI